MADLTALDDVGHFCGSDLILSPTGDLQRVNNAARSKQKILRRLLTNPGEYLFHPNYGAGLPRMVGQLVDVGRIKGLIRGQMLLEASVARTPEPEVKVTEITGGVSVSVTYTVMPDRQPVALSFDVSA